MNYLRIKCESRVIIESVADQPDDTVVINTVLSRQPLSLCIVIGLSVIYNDHETPSTRLQDGVEDE